LYQALSEEAETPSCGVYGLSGVDSWNDDFVKEFDRYEHVFVVLDNDVDYMVKAKVDAAYLNIRRALGAKTRRIILPNDVKDLCEFFDQYGMTELRALAKRRAKSESRFKPLDLTKAPPPMDWLVEGLVASGDVTICVGDPGLGKSWVAMDLAVKLANNQGEKSYWLGHEILKRGPVLYIDEENPLDVIYWRLKKLGLTTQGTRNLRYLYEPKIWLNKDPGPLLEEALEFNPALIVLDSLSRVHSEDENSAGAMAQLFKEGIKPLARETGAACLLIHHVIKSENGSGFQRARGSGDITAVVDAGLDMRSTGVQNVFTVNNYKSRRIKGGETLTVRITDKPDGGVALVTDASVPF
jgi:RecA-family ATPase